MAAALAARSRSSPSRADNTTEVKPMGAAAPMMAMAAAAPIGFTSVVLSAREGLDLDLAASAAAISVFLGSLWIPLAMVFVPR